MRHTFLLSVILLTLINGTYIEVKAQDATDPTVTISNVPDTTQNGEFEITITFSETVTGFEDEDIELGGGVTATASLTGSGTNYTATITPTSSGNLTIMVPADAADGNQASSIETVTIDLPPTVTFTVPSTVQNAAFEVTITFDESVSGLEADDIELTTLTGTVSTPVGTGAEYTVTITPDADQEGSITIKLIEDAVQDTGSNNNKASAEIMVTVDTIAPTVEITGIPTIEKNEAFDIIITFSESVTDFDVDDLIIAGVVETGTPATATLVPGGTDSASYTVTITPEPNFEDNVTITVREDAVTDTAGNSSTASDPATVHFDTILPEVTEIRTPLTAENEPEPQNTDFPITVVFSEAVTNFDATDLTIEAPTEIQDTVTATLLSGETETEYTFNIRPNPGAQIPIFEGDITITVREDTVKDLALNDNTASDPATVHFDTILPEVTDITDVPTIEKNVAFNITITFSEEVNGFAVADLTITGPATASLSSGTDGHIVYIITITPDPGEEDDVTIKVDADTVKDLALNNNTASNTTDPVHVDTIVPEVTDITGIPTIEKNVAFDIIITFSEEVNGFAVADLTINGPATATLKSGADGDTEYTVTITPNSTDEGDVTIKVDANAVKDFALNNNTASDTTDSIHVDTIVPTVEVRIPEIEKNVAFDITIAFDEPVNGFEASDITTNGPVTVSPPSWNNGNTDYTLTITPSPGEEGDFTIKVNADTVKDFALNGNTPSETATVHVDTIVPTVEITDIPDTVQLEAFSLTILFSEDVNDFVLEDISFSGDAEIETKELTGTGSTYTLTITPHEDTDGDVIVQVPADIALDLATNLNTASFSEIVSVAPIWIPDPNLRAVIRDGLGLGLGDDFSRTELEDLIILNGPSRQIDDLTGLENATNLTQLDLNDNFISDLNPLSDLTVLTTLKLNDNSITAIDALENLVNLTTLELSGNRIATLPALTDLINLKTLDLSENRIKNLSPIAGLTALTNLNLTANQISDVSPLENLKNLLILQISQNPITDTAALTGLAKTIELDGTIPSLVADSALRNVIQTHLGLTEAEQITQANIESLTTLELESSGITSLAGLEYATALTTLNLSDNSITDITLLQGLSQLTTLTLNDNSITDITPLQDLTALTNLDLGDNSIADIAPLQDLDALTTLTLSNNLITDFATLAELTTLTALALSRNSITDLNVISQLPQLLTLDISDNPITDITLLQNLTALTTLNLRGNTVSNLNPILQLTDLTNLDLSSTSARDLRPLAGLTQLTTLHLNGNTLSDLTPLATLTNLTTLSIAENTITRLNAITTLTQLTTLTLKGNSITDVTPLASLPQLTTLDLRDNTIGDVTPLAGFLNLRTLYLMGNPILDTTPLYPLTQRIPPVDIDIVVSQYPPWDVNQDGNVDAVDSALVTAALGQNGEAIANPRTDVNGDGTVDNADLLLVTENFDNNDAGAPVIANILTPEKTRLLANYPNPFNPETWIPYHLAHPSNVVLTIYDIRGAVIRRLELGHQGAGYYIKKHRAAYWDGRNSVGEPVASGVYFYQLQTDNTAMLRKMVILK